MARICRWSVMIYGSLEAEFMETKYNDYIHRCGTPIFGKFVTVKYNLIQHAKSSFYIKSRVSLFFVVFLALSITAWKRHKQM